jgi:hypothetical protein
MQSDFELRRRVLVKLYRRYIVADRDFVVATRAAIGWLPEAPPDKLTQIGNPGSRVRRLYDRREDALERFHAARAKLERARERRGLRQGRVILLLPS